MELKDVKLGMLVVWAEDKIDEWAKYYKNDVGYITGLHFNGLEVIPLVKWTIRVEETAVHHRNIETLS